MIGYGLFLVGRHADYRSMIEHQVQPRHVSMFDASNGSDKETFVTVLMDGIQHVKTRRKARLA